MNWFHVGSKIPSLTSVAMEDATLFDKAPLNQLFYIYDITNKQPDWSI